MDVDVRQVRVTTDAENTTDLLAPSGARFRVHSIRLGSKDPRRLARAQCDIDHVVQLVGLSIATTKPSDMLQPQEPRP